MVQPLELGELYMYPRKNSNIYVVREKKKYRHLCKTICAEFLPRTMLGIKKFSNPSVRTIRSEFFIEQSITILINSSCNV